MATKIQFFCEKYPEYCTEGIRFSNHKYVTDKQDEIDKIRRSPIYRGYVKETEIDVPDSSSPTFQPNIVDPEEMAELVETAKEKTKIKRGRVRQGVVTTENLKKQR